MDAEDGDADFQVLQCKRRPPVQLDADQVLPGWLQGGKVVSNRIGEDGVFLGDMKPQLSARLGSLFTMNGVTRLFPVQAEVIPELLAWKSRRLTIPQDLCICSPTGSGKTLCYVIPIVDFLADSALRCIQALVVLPTADLATQIYEQFLLYTRSLNIKVVLVTGEHRFSDEVKEIYEETCRGLAATCQVLIATPGRLLDHLRSPYAKAFSLVCLRFLVLDEADLLLADQDLHWFKEVEAAVYDRPAPEIKDDDVLLPPLYVKRVRVTEAMNMETLSLALATPLQKILLSATLSFNATLIEKIGLYRPMAFYCPPVAGTDTEDGYFTFPAQLSHFHVMCEEKDKPMLLCWLLRRHEYKRILCFTDTRRHSQRLSELLRLMGQNDVQEISKNVSKVERNAVYKQFETKEVNVIICSQMMARGMHFEDIYMVICYDAPQSFEQYAHMAGRTARAGKSGMIVTMITKETEARRLRDKKHLSLVDFTKPFDIDHRAVDSLRQEYKNALAALKEKYQDHHKGKG